ncbi:MAG: aminodeoxychorismate synthase component I [Myxococcota bacterium]
MPGIPSPPQPLPWVEPARAFAALADPERGLPGVAFLDSAGDLRDVSRWAVLGADPFDVVEARVPPAEGGSAPGMAGARDPFGVLAAILARYARPAGPVPFAGGGMLGYLGYGLRHFLERLPRPRRQPPEPALFFGLYDTLFVFDRLSRRTWLVSTGLPERGARAAALRRKARAKAFIGMLAATGSLSEPAPRARREAFPGPPLESATAFPAAFSASMGPAAFGEAVERARALIRAGDIYQVNLSYAVEARAALSPAALYARLRRISPAPFGAYIDAGAFQILSNSPERFLLLADGRVETRPIKGTRPRRVDGVADAGEAAELLASAKDRAEHVMIVDLERSDLGRIAEAGTVRVDRMAGLESYASVHHLVSVVSARPRAGLGPADILRACFPGGSITGAPKIRAMEIIAALETVPRGIYTGAIGGIDFSGRMDFSVAIRTAVAREGRVRFHVGGGIVADSKPEEEYRETLTKAEAFGRLLSPDG